MHEDLSQLTISSSASIREALTAIDRGHYGIVLVNSAEGKIEGLMTDGDLRRLLLSGLSLDSPIAGKFGSKFTYVAPNTPRADVLDLMSALSIEHIPIIDQKGYAVGLHRLGNVFAKTTLPNWAVIMAGGKGSRLGELTQETPKPMLKVAGRPIIERIVLHLVGAGIRKIFISVNYLGHQIEEHFQDGRNHGCEIEYLRETEPLGTGGALSLLPTPPTDPLLVMNGDLITDFNVRKLLGFHTESGFAATMGLAPYHHQVPFGCVELEEGKILSFHEKPLISQLVNSGIYVISPNTLQTIPKRFFPITEIFEKCLGEGMLVGGYPIDDDWTDIGRPEELSMARGDL